MLHCLCMNEQVKLTQKVARGRNRSGSYIGSIPNTPAHRRLVLVLSKLLRPYGKVQIEGRHSNRKLLAHNLCAMNHSSCVTHAGHKSVFSSSDVDRRRQALRSHVPVDFAESFDVYLLKTEDHRNPLKNVPKYWNLTLEEAEVCLPKKVHEQS